MTLAGTKLPGKAINTGDYGKFASLDLGTVEVGSPGQFSLSVKPIKAGWQPINLKSIQLKPAN